MRNKVFREPELLIREKTLILKNTYKKNSIPHLNIKGTIRNVNENIAVKLTGEDVFRQNKIDKKLIEIDGTENKSNLGANGMCRCSSKIFKYATL